VYGLEIILDLISEEGIVFLFWLIMEKPEETKAKRRDEQYP
jgi:hypothetical protein